MTVNKKFIIFTLGVFVHCCGVIGTIALVSSLNVEDGLGTNSLAVAFGSSIISAFLIPTLINSLGCRIVIILAELGYLLFVLSNVYSSYNLLLGGVFYGFGEAAVWTAYPTVASRFASQHAVTGSKSSAAYRNHYIGYMFAGVQASTIFGNLAGFLVLYVDRSISNRFNITHYVDYSVCGANDCQDVDDTLINLDQYMPAYVGTRYIVIAVFAFFIVIAMLLHIFFLPNDRPLPQRISKVLKEPCSKNEKHETNEVLFHGEDVKLNSNVKKQTAMSNLKYSLLSSFELFISPKHLLVVLLPIYNGLTMGFVIGELTRSYAACILGLDKVAVGAILFGVGDTIFSYLAGKTAGKFGRNMPYTFAFVLDIGNYVFCLLWTITDDNVWLVYVLFFSVGVTDGVWQTLINVMYEEYFSVQREIAFNLWNVLVNIGTFTQFAISLWLCVYHKIYLQIIVLCLAVISYGLSQLIYGKSNRQVSVRPSKD